MQPAAVDAHKQVVENPLDDLSKGQGHDGQVVPLQPQDRDANEKAHQSGKQGAHNHTDNQTDRPGGDVVCLLYTSKRTMSTTLKRLSTPTIP